MIDGADEGSESQVAFTLSDGEIELYSDGDGEWVRSSAAVILSQWR